MGISTVADDVSGRYDIRGLSNLREIRTKFSSNNRRFLAARFAEISFRSQHGVPRATTVSDCAFGAAPSSAKFNAPPPASSVHYRTFVPSTRCVQYPAVPASAAPLPYSIGGGVNVFKSGMKDVPQWLKGLRLHKYTPIFQRLSYSQMMAIEEAQLERINVTQGARRKILQHIQRLRERPRLLAEIDTRLSVLCDSDTICEAIGELCLVLTTPICAEAADNLPELILKLVAQIYVSLFITRPESANNNNVVKTPQKCGNAGDRPQPASAHSKKRWLLHEVEDIFVVRFAQVCERILSHEEFKPEQKQQVSAYRIALRHYIYSHGLRLNSAPIQADSNSSNGNANAKRYRTSRQWSKNANTTVQKPSRGVYGTPKLEAKQEASHERSAGQFTSYTVGNAIIDTEKYDSKWDGNNLPPFQTAFSSTSQKPPTERKSIVGPTTGPSPTRFFELSPTQSFESLEPIASAGSVRVSVELQSTNVFATWTPLTETLKLISVSGSPKEAAEEDGDKSALSEGAYATGANATPDGAAPTTTTRFSTLSCGSCAASSEPSSSDRSSSGAGSPMVYNFFEDSDEDYSFTTAAAAYGGDFCSKIWTNTSSLSYDSERIDATMMLNRSISNDFVAPANFDSHTVEQQNALNFLLLYQMQPPPPYHF